MHYNKSLSMGATHAHKQTSSIAMAVDGATHMTTKLM